MTLLQRPLSSFPPTNLNRHPQPPREDEFDDVSCAAIGQLLSGCSCYWSAAERRLLLLLVSYWATAASIGPSKLGPASQQRPSYPLSCKNKSSSGLDSRHVVQRKSLRFNSLGSAKVKKVEVSKSNCENFLKLKSGPLRAP